MLVGATVGSSTVIEHALAQSAQTPDAPQNGVLLTKLSDPTYPRLALQARITGDVDLMLAIRRDGSVESVVVVSGHPLLKQAALDSAERSQFECRGCGEDANPYALKYKFRIAPRDPPKDCGAQADESQPPVELDLAGHQVIVSAWEIWTCDPTAQVVKVRFRSAKCLYFWRCGARLKDQQPTPAAPRPTLPAP